MNTIVNLMDFKERGRKTPTLVLVDLHDDVHGAFEGDDMTGAIRNCRSALDHARACGFPIAFTRQASPPASLTASPRYPRWIKGFEPKRSDMIFDRQHPSCYSNSQFAEMVDYIGGNYVIVGQLGDGSCLSTAIDAFHRDHRITVLIDALTIRGCDERLGLCAREASTRVISLYAQPESTDRWIRVNPSTIRARV